MTESDASKLPIDPTFPPAAYERVAWLLRGGVLGFVLLAGAGMVAYLALHPSETVSEVLAGGPSVGLGSFVTFLGGLAVGRPSAIILAGIYVMVAVTVGRVVLATFDLYRGGEKALGGLSATVVVLLLIALFVVAPFVQ